MLLFLKSNVNDFERPFWHLGSAIGLSFTMIGTLMGLTLLRQPSTILNLALENTIIINEAHIYCKKPNAEVKYEWKYFKFYELKGTCIIL